MSDDHSLEAIWRRAELVRIQLDGLNARQDISRDDKTAASIPLINQGIALSQEWLQKNREFRTAHQRRWRQFSLRTLFGAMTVFAVIAGTYPLGAAYLLGWAAATATITGIIVLLSRTMERLILRRDAPLPTDITPPPPTH